MASLFAQTICWPRCSHRIYVGLTVRTGYLFTSLFARAICSPRLSVRLAVRTGYLFASLIAQAICSTRCSPRLSVRLAVRPGYLFASLFAQAICSPRLSVRLAVRIGYLFASLFAQAICSLPAKPLTYICHIYFSCIQRALTPLVNPIQSPTPECVLSYSQALSHTGPVAHRPWHTGPVAHRPCRTQLSTAFTACRLLAKRAADSTKTGWNALRAKNAAQTLAYFRQNCLFPTY